MASWKNYRHKPLLSTKHVTLRTCRSFGIMPSVPMSLTWMELKLPLTLIPSLKTLQSSWMKSNVQKRVDATFNKGKGIPTIYYGSHYYFILVIQGFKKTILKQWSEFHLPSSDHKLVSEIRRAGWTPTEYLSVISSQHTCPHLTGVFPTQEWASADHVLRDPEVVVVPAILKDVHIHGPQYRWQAVAGKPSHPPAADCAHSKIFQRRRVLVRQRGQIDPGVDISWAVQLRFRGHVFQSLNINSKWWR